jgi:hypothetical protein
VVRQGGLGPGERVRTSGGRVSCGSAAGTLRPRCVMGRRAEQAAPVRSAQERTLAPEEVAGRSDEGADVSRRPPLSRRLVAPGHHRTAANHPRRDRWRSLRRLEPAGRTCRSTPRLDFVATCALVCGCRCSRSLPTRGLWRGWPPMRRRGAGTGVFVWDQLRWREPIKASGRSVDHLGGDRGRDRRGDAGPHGHPACAPAPGL